MTYLQLAGVFLVGLGIGVILGIAIALAALLGGKGRG